MNSAENTILVLNGGSSSIKFALFAINATLRLKLKGQIERIGTPDAVLVTQAGEHEAQVTHAVAALDYASAINVMIGWIDEKQMDGTLIAVGHRIVHGGARFHAPQRLTQAMMTQLQQLAPLDQQHMPGEIALVDAFRQRFSKLPQIACFDTAFHHHLPRVADRKSVV